MKSKLCNRLIDHLDLVVCMFFFKKITLNNFLYNDVILVEKKAKKQYDYNT
jgi:hypothetical protein